MAKQFDPMKHFDRLSQAEKDAVRKRLKEHGLSAAGVCCAAYILGASDAGGAPAGGNDGADSEKPEAPQAKSGTAKKHRFRKNMDAMMANKGVDTKAEGDVFTKMRGKVRKARVSRG